MEIDQVDFYVEDATQIQDFLVKQMGLHCLGCEVNDHTIEYLVGNSHLLFSVSSPLNGDSPVAEYLKIHPSGVKNIRFRVRDLAVIRQRVECASAPQSGRFGVNIINSSSGADDLPWIEIQGWGSIDHTIIQAPAASKIKPIDLHESTIGIDHLVLNVAAGELESATSWYQNIFDFQVQQIFDIQTQTSGLTSNALVSQCGKIRFNINQPSSSNSQIQQFLDRNNGAGIQHIALQTNDIFTTIDRMQQQGLTCLEIDRNYYTQLQIRARTTQISLLTAPEWLKLQQLQILVDWADSAPEALLLQIFTEPIFESPTFFFEIIERRHRATGFGKGNFQALFEAIEAKTKALDVV
jgi:4-hydroxyphenylpyruvate dioxygenase